MDFYKSLYADANKILDTISTLGSDALYDIEEVSQNEVTEQLKGVNKKQLADDEEIVAELLKFGGEANECEIVNILPICCDDGTITVWS